MAYGSPWQNPDTGQSSGGGWYPTMGGIGGGIGSMAGGIAGLFQKNPAEAGKPYLDQISQQTGKYFDPYNQAGQNMLGGLSGQYNDLMNDPGGKLNSIGGSFQQSPGFKFALQQALAGANQASSAGGMLGSPQASQQNMQLANDMANQDYYNWLGKATGLYGQGLEGGQNMANQGLQAGTSQANMVAQQLAAQAQNAQENQYQQNQKWGQAFSGIGQGLGQMAFL